MGVTSIAFCPAAARDNMSSNQAKLRQDREIRNIVFSLHLTNIRFNMNASGETLVAGSRRGTVDSPVFYFPDRPGDEQADCQRSHCDHQEHDHQSVSFHGGYVPRETSEIGGCVSRER